MKQWDKENAQRAATARRDQEMGSLSNTKSAEAMVAIGETVI